MAALLAGSWTGTNLSYSCFLDKFPTCGVCLKISERTIFHRRPSGYGGQTSFSLAANSFFN